MNRPPSTDPSPRLDALLTFPARRPAATLVASGLVLLVAGLGLFHVRLNTSLQTMFPEGKPSAEAMVGVLERFPASNELVLLATDPAGDDGPPDPDRAAKLLAFAQRFEQEIHASPDAAVLTAGVIYRPDPEFLDFSQDVVIPAGLYYLDDAAYAEARRRLTPAGMREQLARTAADLAAPGVAGGIAKAKADDPLRLYEFFLGRLVGQQQFKTLDGGQPVAPRRAAPGTTRPTRPELPPFVSPDGRAILVRVVSTTPPSDLDYCERLVKAVSAAADRANVDRLKLDYTGAYAAADFSHRAIRRDSTESIVVSIVLLQVLFLVVYRRPFRQFILELSPVVIGVFAGFGLYGWTRGGLSPVAAVIGGILAGMGIDYSVLYLAAYFRHLAAGLSPVEAVRATASRTVGAMFAAWFTSAIGFVAIAWSSVPTLRDFALLGAMGLAGTFLAVVFVLPAVVVLWDVRRLARGDTPAARRMPFRWDVRPMLAGIHRHRRAFVGGAAVLFVVSAVYSGTRPGGPVPLESDLHVMHPQPNPALAAEAAIAKRFGSEPGALFVHLKADSAERLVALSYDVDRRLSQAAVREAGITGSFGLSSLLPDPAVTAGRMPQTDVEARQVADDFRAALADSDLNPDRYAAYPEFLTRVLTMRLGPGNNSTVEATRQPPTVETLRAYPRLWRSLLPSVAAAGQAPTEAITLVFVGRPTSERASREAMVSAARAALAGVAGATLTGLPVISLDTEEATRRDLPLLLGIAAGLVLVVLLAYYRSIASAALALAPLVFSLTVLAAVARLTDTKLNLVNLVALPLLVGIDVDYGIYFVSMAGKRRAAAAASAGAEIGRPTGVTPVTTRIAASAQAVITCAAASALGFGSLISVSVPAVRSLGIVVAVGVVASLIGTFALRAPALMAREAADGRGIS